MGVATASLLLGWGVAMTFSDRPSPSFPFLTAWHPKESPSLTLAASGAASSEQHCAERAWAPGQRCPHPWAGEHPPRGARDV